MKKIFFALSLMAIPAAPQSLLQKASQKAAVPLANPYNGDANAVRAGQKLFANECAGCHGAEGKGRGRPRTPVLASPTVREASPAALFWILRNGSSTHRMPSFSSLPDEQRWQIIAYLQRSAQ